MKEIKLTKNKITLIDDEDYEILSKFKWVASKHPTNVDYYAKRAGKNKDNKVTTISMHREIMNCPKNMQIDHINGNTLDNRKCNLRIVTPSQNSKNRAHQRKAQFKYKGISRHDDCFSKPFRARISVNGKTLSLGMYKTIEEAALAYNLAAVKYFGEFARLNQINT